MSTSDQKRLDGSPKLYVRLDENPWLAGHSLTGNMIYLEAGSKTIAETARLTIMEAGVGEGTSPEPYKVTEMTVMKMMPGAPSSHARADVNDVGVGVGPVNAIVHETDINVRNMHYGDAWGVVEYPVAFARLIATGGDKRATGGEGLDCGNVAANNVPANFGWVGFSSQPGGGVRQAMFADLTNSHTTLLGKGAKVNGVDFSQATFTGHAFRSLGYAVGPNGELYILGMLPVTPGANDSAGTGYRALRIPNA